MKNRQRGRNGGKPRPMGGGGGGGGRNPNFDGGNRPRGNAQQLMEKFLAMARDASSAGDRVLAENYFQHADHYYRVLNARFEQQNGQGGQQQHHNPQHQNQPQGQHGQHNNGRPQYQSNDDNRGNQLGPHDNQGYDNQPGNQGNHHQPAYVQAPQPQPQPQPQAAPQAEAEIGLPPGILGVAPPVPGGSDSEEAAEGEAPRPQQGRRRRGPPRERAAGE